MSKAIKYFEAQNRKIVINAIRMLKLGRNLVDFDKIVREIPQGSLEKVSDELVKVLLGSPNTDKMPERLAKAILRHWQCDELSSPAGVKVLLEASMTLEEEKTKASLQALGVQL